MTKGLKKLLTIIAEAQIEDVLTEQIKKLGAHGFTVVEARGEGSRGVRAGEWDQSRSIRIEVICEPQIAEAISGYLIKNYSADYALVLYLSDVEVIRGEKF